MWETGVGTSEVPSGDMDGAQEGGREETKDRGKGPSRLMLVDKGKGKEMEVMEEETLQEE